MAKKTAADIRIVLVNPAGGRNIGAVCRAMKNMGLSRLVLVDPRPVDPVDVKTLALHAFDVYERSETRSTLEAVLGEDVFSAGFTRRDGRKRKGVFLLPEQLAERIGRIRTGVVDLVFGNEEHGLTDSELALCNAAVSIPTAAAFSSLNLSHAVQIAAYVLYRSRKAAPVREPVKRRELDGMVAGIVGNLKAIGFFHKAGPGQMTVFLRDIFARAALSEFEAGYLAEVFRRVEKHAFHPPVKKPGLF